MPTLRFVRQMQVGLYASPIRNTFQPEVDLRLRASAMLAMDFVAHGWRTVHQQ